MFGALRSVVDLRVMGQRTPAGSGSARPLVYGHRGASAHAPENTVEAFSLAIEQGADGVELDARLTRDGELIIHHDESPADGLSPFIESDLRDIRASFPSIPTLDEAWDAVGPGGFVNIEIKSARTRFGGVRLPRVSDRVAGWLERTPAAPGRVIVSSFDPWSTRRVRREAPGILTGQLFTELAPPSWAIKWAARDRHETINLPRARVLADPAVVVSRAAAADLGVFVWTVDEPDEALTLARAGVVAIITNDPPTVLGALD